MIIKIAVEQLLASLQLHKKKDMSHAQHAHASTKTSYTYVAQSANVDNARGEKGIPARALRGPNLNKQAVPYSFYFLN